MAAGLGQHREIHKSDITKRYFKKYTRTATKILSLTKTQATNTMYNSTNHIRVENYTYCLHKKKINY
jgi:hypothetical protein